MTNLITFENENGIKTTSIVEDFKFTNESKNSSKPYFKNPISQELIINFNLAYFNKIKLACARFKIKIRTDYCSYF